MTLPTFTLRQMVEAGVHFGHHARRWNPSMAPYIYGKKDNIHIIDLQKTYPMLYTALNAAREVAAQGGKILFVGTKRQAQDLIKENAERCGQYYVNHRWLGGMLTNWKTVYKSISRLVKLNEMFEKNAFDGYTKKEMQNIKKEQEKLNKELGGIMNMGGQPDMLFVIDTPKAAKRRKKKKFKTVKPRPKNCVSPASWPTVRRLRRRIRKSLSSRAILPAARPNRGATVLRRRFFRCAAKF